MYVTMLKLPVFLKVKNITVVLKFEKLSKIVPSNNTNYFTTFSIDVY